MPRHLAHLRRAAELLGEDLRRAAHRERALLEVARHVERPALVAEVALQLAEDRRRGVARELRPAAGLEAVDRLDQAEARDLQAGRRRARRCTCSAARGRVPAAGNAPRAPRVRRGLRSRGSAPAGGAPSRVRRCPSMGHGDGSAGSAEPQVWLRSSRTFPSLLDSQVRCATALYDCATSPSCTQRAPVRIRLLPTGDHLNFLLLRFVTKPSDSGSSGRFRRGEPGYASSHGANSRTNHDHQPTHGERGRHASGTPPW